jgi:protein gp37
MDLTNGKWWDESWNPIQDSRKGSGGRGYHCTKANRGCRLCWAEGVNRRFGNGHPFDDNPDVKFELVNMEKPLRTKRPTLWFLQDMGDLFHDLVSDQMIHDVFAVVKQCLHHRFIVVTKRAKRMYEYSRDYGWPSNAWAMVSVVDQESADQNMPYIVRIKSPVRGLSMEPLLEAVNLQKAYVDIDESTKFYPLEVNTYTMGDYVRALNWIIIGGESGIGARQLHARTVYTMLYQLFQQKKKVPLFFKQWGMYNEKGELVGKKLAGRVIGSYGHDVNGALYNGRTFDQFPEEFFLWKQ